MKKRRNTFGGSIGFVLAAAGSAVGLGNIWRFPYLAAKDGGGLFLVVYIVLALTFGFTLLTTEIAIGRKTKQSPLTAYSRLKKGWKPLGIIACLVPVMILPYYATIGGWVLKYFLLYVTGNGVYAAEDECFNGFIQKTLEPQVMMFVFLFAIAFIIFKGVNKGIESFSKFIMPVLLLFVIGISIYSLTISYTDDSGVTVKGFCSVVMDAMGQLFFSLSVAMGIMIAYGSYVSDDSDLGKSINQIELFDTIVAFLAGVMIIPAVYTFMGVEGMEASGPSLMFVSLPKVFASMGMMGNVIGTLFFAMVLFAALTSGVSVMEAVVSSLMDEFHISRIKATVVEGIVALVGGSLVCLGYNKLFFNIVLPNGSNAQILDVLDYISNNALIPIVSISTCILVGWILKPQVVIDEIEKTGKKMGRKSMYVVMIKYIAPVLLTLLLLKSLGVLTVI